VDPKPPVDHKPPFEPKPKPPVDSKPPVDAKPPVDPKPVVHRVRPGEYLTFIADCYDVSWKQLYDYNREAIGPEPDILHIGTRLEIPPKDYQPGKIRYRQIYEPGHTVAGMTCVATSPKAQRESCNK
jgi:hypothetical protein